MPPGPAAGPATKDRAFFVLEPSRGVLLPGERTIVKVVFTPGDVRSFSHKVALKDIKKGDTIWKYGQDIGIAKANIGKGEHVHVHNVKTKRW